MTRTSLGVWGHCSVYHTLKVTYQGVSLDLGVGANLKIIHGLTSTIFQFSSYPHDFSIVKRNTKICYYIPNHHHYY